MRTIITTLVVVVVLIILVRACGGGESSTTSSESEDKAEEKREIASKQEEQKKESKQEKEKQKKQKQETAVGIGQPVAAGDIEWTVTDAARANQLSQERFGQFGKTKQGDFVIVDLLFTNNSNEPETLTTNSITLLDSSGRESRPDTDTFGYIEPERNIFLEQVNPGVTKEGEVIFTVASDASGFRLQLGDARMFGSEDAYVDLGF
jgi:hypothetical protein